jgi:hypothetical protein
MAQTEKRFKTVLSVPKVWQSLLEIQSFDDLSLFLQQKAPPEAVGLDGFTLADWPRPIVNDHRKVSFTEDEHMVALELLSGNDHYFALASVVLPTGEKYAHSGISHDIASVEVLEIPGVAKFAWHQRLI